MELGITIQNQRQLMLLVGDFKVRARSECNHVYVNHTSWQW